METGFLIGTSSCSNSTGSSCFLEHNSSSKADAEDSASQVVKDRSQGLKLMESSLNSAKGNLLVSCDDVATCKTPILSCTFDLSNLSSANNSKASSMVDVFCDNKYSTPCKDEKVAKLDENLSKSTEMNDLAVFKKPPPPPLWEISGIQATLDNNTLSLEASGEELGSLSMLKPDTPSLEMSHYQLQALENVTSAVRHLAPAL